MNENLDHTEGDELEATSIDMNSVANDDDESDDIMNASATEGQSDSAGDAGHAPRVARSATGHAIPQAQTGVAGGIRTNTNRHHTPRARRMNLSLTRFDAWSVAKVSFLLGVAGGIIQIVAAGLVWGLLNAVGVFDQVTQIVSSTGLDASGFNLADVFSLSTVLSAVTIFSIIEVVLITVLITIAALLYNVVSSLVGGVHVTLGDD